MSQPTAADLRRSILNTAPKAPPYAGFWRRASAHAIDGTIVLVATYLFSLLTTSLKLPGDISWTVNAIGYILISGSYFVLQESSLAQATLGKRCLGLRVVSADSQQTLGQGQALLRNLYKLTFTAPIAALFAQIFSLTCLLVLFTQRKQGGADILSGSIVIAGPKPRLYARFETAWMIAIFALVVGLPLMTVALGFSAEPDSAGVFGREDFQSQVKKIASATVSRSAPATPEGHNPLDEIEAKLERTLKATPHRR